ncbi:MAG: aminotransferase class V-fold PLP-dependent enzyme [Candidatus Nitrosocaldus sp.]|nr:aminotransferase class V-fold PLP-dependent enzyme [Candidatus Nitrosocaldus sp.]
MAMAIDPESIKRDFPRMRGIYLNNASSAPIPFSAIKAVTDLLISYDEYGPDSSASAAMLDGILSMTRREVARLINCSEDEIVFTQSTTHAINMVANGLTINKDDTIVIRDGEHEHPANHYAWLVLGRRGARIRTLSIRDEDGGIDVEELREMVDSHEGVRLVALSHVLFNTGLILPVEEVSKILRERGIHLFIDAAQSVGCMDVDVKRLGCSFMAFPSSKWLCAPPGLGILYCSREAWDDIEPSYVGGESAFIHEGSLHYREMPYRMQAGFRGYALLAGLLASLQYIGSIGIARIRNWNMHLAEMVREGLKEYDDGQHIRLYGPEDSRLRSSIVSFSLKRGDGDGRGDDGSVRSLVRELEKEGIIVAERDVLKKKIVRVSPHFFNSEDDIARFLTTLRRLLPSLTS